MKRYLLVNPFGIGDVLFTTPVIRAIKESEPDSIIGYWCNERVKDILENNPDIYKIFALSRGDLKKVYKKSFGLGLFKFLNLIYGIKKERFDSMVDFSLDHRYSLLAKIIGVKERVGFNYKNRGRFLTDKISLDGYNDKHVVEYYLDLLKPFGIKPKSSNLELFISQENMRASRDYLAGYGINGQDLIVGIVAGAGASWGHDASLKHWPQVNFARLADRIMDNFQAKIIILGDKPERPVADEIIKSMHNKPIDLVDKLNLKELSAVINNLHILIANDGGPLHIAVALGKKTVSFFGPTDPGVYGPYPPCEKRHIVLRKDIGCSPCYIKFRLSGCKRNKECLSTIGVDSAFDAVARLL